MVISALFRLGFSILMNYNYYLSTFIKQMAVERSSDIKILKSNLKSNTHI